MVMVRHTEDYQRFLVGATAALARAGAQVLLGAELPEGHRPADWVEGWDRVLASNQPGSRRVYAFTDGQGLEAGELRERVSRLADGVASAGYLRGLPLRVVAVIVYPAGLGTLSPRTVTRLTPRTFHPGLRPSTWAVDLPARRAHTPGLLKPQEARQLERVAAAAGEGEVIDQSGIAVLEQEHARRNLAFYQLMRARQPYVTYALIAINVAIYALLNVNGGPQNVTTLRDFGALSATLVEQGQWWRVFTSMFLHASVTHILFNMVSLFAIGTLAERLYGSVKFLAIYLGAGLIGSMASILYAIASGHPDELGVGASGAIFGVAGALLTVRFQHSDVIPLRLRNQVSTSLLPLVALSLVFSFLTPYVDNSAHIGGLVGGAALSFLFPLVKSFPEGALDA
jgi:membrane associated rhomboid family serine protease